MNDQQWQVLKLPGQILITATIVFTILFFVLPTGCNETVIVPAAFGQISMTAQYSLPNTFIKNDSKNTDDDPMEIDSLRITRARCILSDIKYKSVSDSANFHISPVVIELNLASVIQKISMSDIPFGTYHTIDFDVYRLEKSDVSSLPRSEQVKFKDFIADERYSIIISGRIFIGKQSIVFTFRSRVSAKQSIALLPELAVTDETPEVNATILFNSDGWFRSSSGSILDPFDALNEEMISDNVRASIMVFKDIHKASF